MASGGTLASRFNFSSLKAGLKKYGKAGLYTYLGLSTCITASESGAVSLMMTKLAS